MTAQARRTVACSLVAVVVIAAAAYGLAVLLQGRFAPLAAVVELDVAGLEVGQLRAYKTWEGEFWVVRRSPEQIRALENVERDLSRARARGVSSTPIGDSPLRSADPAFFVFRVQRIGDGIMLRQYLEQYVVCSDLRLFRGQRTYPGGNVIRDGLSCADDPQVAYDLAGRPGSPYFAPLEVPEHEVHRGRLILHPRP